MIDASVKQTEPMTVAFIQMNGSYDRMPQGFQKLYKWIQDYEHTPQGMPMAVYLSPPQAEESGATWEIWAPIEGGAIQFGPDNRSMGIKQIEPTLVASTVHKGPYEQVAPVYRELFGWVDEHGLEVCGPPREVYMNDPGEASAEEYLTEIEIPVRKR